jgi:hypothetical protein
MNLAEKFRRLAHALEPLGIEIGPDVLDVWHDRHVHGRDPLPPTPWTNSLIPSTSCA